MDWKIAIPTVLLLLIVVCIIKMFRRILEEKGRKAPGVRELIIGCFLLAFGNIIQILPGNNFPWDTLFGAAFAIMFIISLYRRRMFDTKQVISSSILVLASVVMCVVAAAYFFERVAGFMAKFGGHLGNPDTEAFVLLAVVLFWQLPRSERCLSPYSLMRSGRATA